MRRLVLAVFFAAAIGAAASPPGEILVFGAASLTESLQEAGKQFEAKGGARVAFSFASSSDLARQIEAGAPADVFFSADTAKMDSVEKAGLVKEADRREFLSNALVVVVPSDSTARVASAKDLEAFCKDRARRSGGRAGRRLREEVADGKGSLERDRAEGHSDARRPRGARRRRRRRRSRRDRLPDGRRRLEGRPRSFTP